MEGGEQPSARAGIEKDIPETAGRVMTFAANITKPEEIQAWMEATTSKFGLLDGAANVASKANPRLFPITDLDVADVQDILNVNVVGLFNCLKEEMKSFREGGGSIVNVGSVLGKYASPGVSAYATSKHAIAGMTKVAAFEGAPKGIRVNIVCPGAIDTDMVHMPLTLPNGQQWSMNQGPEYIPALYPRYSKPEEIATTIAFLLSDEAKMVTKQEWYVDGGWNESTFIPR